MKKNMTIQEMWHYIIFQTKGYRTIKAAIVIGALTAAAVPYVNNIFYAGILSIISYSMVNAFRAVLFLISSAHGLQ